MERVLQGLKMVGAIRTRAMGSLSEYGRSHSMHEPMQDDNSGSNGSTSA